MRRIRQCLKNLFEIALSGHRDFYRFFRCHFSQYLIFSAVALFVLFSSVFSDFLTTQRHGITFWTALFDGHPLKFYDYCMQGGPGYVFGGGSVPGGEAYCAYDFTFYFIFAIWNFPLWVIERIWHINTQAYMIFIVYGKLMMLAALYGCGHQFVRCYHLLMDKRKGIIKGDKFDDSSLFLMLISSLFFTVYSLTNANYDVINVYFMLRGLCFFMEDKRWKFIAAFAIAASLKYFGILLFIPLLLLKEKNILKIIRDTILVLSLSVVEKLLFTTNSVSSLQETAGGYFLDRVMGASMAGSSSALGLGEISLFFIVMGSICLYSYATSIDKPMAYKAVYISAVCWVAFVFFVPLNPHWMVLVTPFLLLVILTGSNLPGLLLLLELIFCVTFYLSYSIQVPHAVHGYNCLGMLLYYVLTVPIVGEKMVSGYSLGHILGWANDVFPFVIYLNSTALLCALGIIWIARPGTERNSRDGKDLSFKHVYNARFAINMFLTILPLALYAVQIIFYHRLTGK